MPKSTKIRPVSKRKTEQPLISTDGCKQIWVFDSIDRDGHFNFDPRRSDIKCDDVLEKIIHYSMRTWKDIKGEKHDSGKTKHHFLSYEALSEKAKARIRKLQLEENLDSIFSMRMSNMVRIVGLRDGEKFIVKWYAPHHEFCPSSN